LCFIAVYVMWAHNSKHSTPAPAGFAIPNPAKSGPGRIWKKSYLVQPWFLALSNCVRGRYIAKGGSV